MALKRSLRSAAAAGFLLVALGGCGSDSKPEAADSATNSAGGDSSATTDQIEVEDFAFKPEQATVKVGTKVTWTFKDDAAHNVDPVGDSELTKSPDLKDGGTFDFTFTKPGLVNYRCGIHNYMTASVMVTA